MHYLRTSCVLLVSVMASIASSQQPFSKEPRLVLRDATVFIGFSPDGETIATTATGNRGIQLFNSTTGELRRFLGQNISGPSRSFLSPNWQTVATLNLNERSVLKLWNVRTEHITARLRHERAGVFLKAFFSPDSKTVATASLDDLSVRLWDSETGESKGTLIHPKPYEYANGVGGVAFTADGKTLVTSSSEKLYLWELTTGQIRNTLTDELVVFWEGFKPRKGFSHNDTIYELIISPDGKMLATGSRDGTAKIWDATKEELRVTLKGHKRGVHRLAFSPDGRILATGSNDKTAKLWDTGTGRLIASLQHRGTVWSIAFSPDGSLVATASDNEKKANVWDAKTGRLVAELAGGRPPVAFSPDGRTLATASRDKTVLLWDVP
ncbi:hypothetical protein BH20ACI2_BH20ACI2_05450 [soil metagenome]